MIDIRRFEDHPHTRLPWLDARHHFNFGSHRHVGRHGWGRLLVWNDDTIDPHSGFDMHGHRDMEIITYVREGAITHRDHLGNRGRTEAGDVQVMSAGEGIMHAEHNEESTPTRLFQIWIHPDAPGGAPRWDHARFPRDGKAGKLVALASGRGHEGALPIRADAALFGATLLPGSRLIHAAGEERYLYLVPAAGAITLNGRRVETGQGAAIRKETRLEIETAGDTPAEILLADVAGQ